MNTKVLPGKIAGNLHVPASKSHTIRALLIASMAGGSSSIIAPLISEDTLSCRDACRLLGAVITEDMNNDQNPCWNIEGTGGKIKQLEKPVDVGNSGTTLYLAASLAALGNTPVTFTGDDQIKSRPVGTLLSSLEDLGVKVERKNGDCAPFTVCGPIKGGRTRIECPTSQYLSSLLLAAPLADGNTEIEVSLLNEQPYAEMTLAWLDDQLISIRNDNFSRFYIPGGQKYNAFRRRIPGDFSSATFFFCAAAICGTEVTIKGLDWNDSQGDKKVVQHLQSMGCRIEIDADFITISRDPEIPLIGRILDLNDTPDALPALAATACYARGVTKIVNVAQARLKETDRISVMAKELMKMGSDISETPDGLIITGTTLSSALLEGHGDHRVVMALAIAALKATGETEISTSEAVDITFPGFFNQLDKMRKDATK